MAGKCSAPELHSWSRTKLLIHSCISLCCSITHRRSITHTQNSRRERWRGEGSAAHWAPLCCSDLYTTHLQDSSNLHHAYLSSKSQVKLYLCLKLFPHLTSHFEFLSRAPQFSLFFQVKLFDTWILSWTMNSPECLHPPCMVPNDLWMSLLTLILKLNCH